MRTMLTLEGSNFIQVFTVWIARANYANIACMNFTKKTDSVQRARELNSRDSINSPVVAVRSIERIFDNFFDFLATEDDRGFSKERLGELRKMKKAVKKAIFRGTYNCYNNWEDVDSIIKENQWTFNALEYLEIYTATRKECITAYAKGKIVHKGKMAYYVFEHVTSILAEASKGNKEVFLKSVKEYNDLTTIRVDFNEEGTHPRHSENPLRENKLLTLEEKRLLLEEKQFFVKQQFLENFDPKIPLELWLNIHFDTTREGENIFTESFQTKEFTNFVKEINRNKKLVSSL